MPSFTLPTLRKLDFTTIIPWGAFPISLILSSLSTNEEWDLETPKLDLPNALDPPLILTNLLTLLPLKVDLTINPKFWNIFVHSHAWGSNHGWSALSYGKNDNGMEYFHSPKSISNRNLPIWKWVIPLVTLLR